MKPKVEDYKLKSHRRCDTQYLGISKVTGLAYRVFFCISHQETFKRLVPIREAK